jgi:hypothetical protein
MSDNPRYDKPKATDSPVNLTPEYRMAHQDIEDAIYSAAQAGMLWPDIERLAHNVYREATQGPM